MNYYIIICTIYTYICIYIYQIIFNSNLNKISLINNNNIFLAQAKLARVWAQHCKESLRHILETLQQLITLRVISTNYSRNFQVQDDESVTMATKLMKVVCSSNIIFLYIILLILLASPF